MPAIRLRIPMAAKAPAIAGIPPAGRRVQRVRVPSASTASSLATKVEHPLTLTPAQLLAATGGATPWRLRPGANGQADVRSGRNHGVHPEQGVLRHRPVSGDDDRRGQAVRRRHPALATVGGGDIQSMPTVRPSRRCRKTDEIYRMTDRGPTSTAARTPKRSCQSGLHPRSPCSSSPTAQRRPARPSSSKAPTATSGRTGRPPGQHRRKPGHDRRPA